MRVRTPDNSRRQVLKAGLGATALFLPVPYAWVWAQSDGAMKLLRLPKLALVIGNGKYEDSKPLTNPVNDAQAISGSLKAAGFEVTTRLDIKREEMLSTVRAYTSMLAKRQCVGLFYFAGHGAQLAWRNYLLPVDAVIDGIEDIPKQCIDLEILIRGVRDASNPMNIIILDACRDNPFGRDFRVNEKGLSQMDAPNSTLLAYATSPGNYASDGDGVNGLYTENLLRELKVPDAKIEDVFKRVRLHVRRTSMGQQIPWESTSLEEDFYFVPPRALATQAGLEADRERKEEDALREKRRIAAEAELKRKQEEAAREARLAAEEAERKRAQELALLEKRRIEEEVERRRKNEFALKEAQRVAEATERKRREEQALREARIADEEAARKYKEELALQEKRRVAQEAERRRREAQAQREIQLAEEAAARKREDEQVLRDKQRAAQEADLQRKQVVAQIQKPTDEQITRLFEEELVIWEKIKASKTPEPLEAYLLRYPSGRFSELAQLRLDLVLARLGEKKIQIVSDEKNPYSRGSATQNTRYKVGDSYSYRSLDLFSKVVQATYINTIIDISDTEVIYAGGFVTNLLGDRVRARDGRRFTDSQITPLEYAIGRRWSSRFYVTNTQGQRGVVELEFRMVKRELVTVPAGTFNAFLVEGRGWSTGASPVPVQLTHNLWYAPDKIRRPIVNETLRRMGPKMIEAVREELVAFKES